MEYRSIFSPIPKSPQTVANSPVLAKFSVPVIPLLNDDFRNDPEVTFNVMHSHNYVNECPDDLRCIQNVSSSTYLRDSKDRPNKENCISLNKIESLPGLTIEERVIDSANDNKSAISKVHSNRSKSIYYKLAKQYSNVYSETFDFDRYVDFLQLYMDSSIKKNEAEIEKINDELESLTENEREEKQELKKEKSIFKKFNNYYKSFLSSEKEQYIPKTVLEIERENENVPKCKPIYKKALTDFVESWKSENVVDDTAKLNLGKCQSMLNNFCTGDHNGNDNDRNIPGQNINAITFGAPSYIPTPIQPTGAASEAVSSSSYTGATHIDLNFVNFNHLFDGNNSHVTNLLPATIPLMPTMLSHSPICNRDEVSYAEILSPSTYLAVQGCNQNTVDLTQLIPDSYLISYSVPKTSYPVENAQLNSKAQTEVLSSDTIKNANADGQDAIPKMTNDNKQSIGHSKEEKKANSHEKTTEGKNVREKSRSSGRACTSMIDKKRHSEESIAKDHKRAKRDEKSDPRKIDQKIITEKFKNADSGSTSKTDKKRHSEESIIHPEDHKRAKRDEKTGKGKKDQKIVTEKSKNADSGSTSKSDKKRHSEESVVHAQDHKRAKRDEKKDERKKDQKIVTEKPKNADSGTTSKSVKKRHSEESVLHDVDHKTTKRDYKADQRKEDQKIVTDKSKNADSGSTSKSDQKRHSKESTVHAKDLKKAKRDEKTLDNKKTEKLVIQELHKERSSSSFRSGDKAHSKQSLEHGDQNKSNYIERTTENIGAQKLIIQQVSKSGGYSTCRSESPSKNDKNDEKTIRNDRKDKTTTKSDRKDGTTTKIIKEDGGTSSYIKVDANNSRMKTTYHEGEDESDDEGDEENLLKQFKKQIKRSASFNAMPLAETMEYLKKNRNPMMSNRCIAEALRGRIVPALDKAFLKRFKIEEHQRNSSTYERSLLRELKAPKRSSFQQSRNHQNQPASLKVVFSNFPDNCDLNATVYPEHVGEENITISSVISKVLSEMNHPFEGSFKVQSSHFGNVLRQHSVAFATKDHVTPHHFFRKETNHTSDPCLFQICYGCIPKAYETELVHLFNISIKESIKRKEKNIRFIEGEIETTFVSLWLVTTQDLCDWDEQKRRTKQKCILAYLFYRMKNICQNMNGVELKVKNPSENKYTECLTKFQEICDNIGRLANFQLDRQTFTLSKAVMVYIKLNFQTIYDVLSSMKSHYESIGDVTKQKQTQTDILTWFRFFRETKTYHYLSPNTSEAVYVVQRQIVDQIEDNYTKTGTVVNISGQSDIPKGKQLKNFTYLSSVSVKTLFSEYIKKSKSVQRKLLHSLNSFLILVFEDLISFLSRNFYMYLPFKLKMTHLETFINYHMQKLKITHFTSQSLNASVSDTKAAKILRQKLVQKLKIAFGNQRVRPESIVVQNFDVGIMEQFLKYFIALVSYATSLIRPCDVDVNNDEVEQIVRQTDRSAYARYPVDEKGKNDELWGNFIIGNLESFIEQRMNTMDSLNFHSTDQFVHDSDDSDFEYESEVERMECSEDSLDSFESDQSDEEECEWNDKEEIDNVDHVVLDESADRKKQPSPYTFVSDTENDSSCDMPMQRGKKSKICYNIKPRQRTSNRSRIKNRNATKNEEVSNVRTIVEVPNRTKIITPMSEGAKRKANFKMERRRKCKLCNVKLSKEVLLLEEKLAVCACLDCFAQLNNLLRDKGGDVNSVLSFIAERIKAKARAPVAFTDDGKLLLETDIKYMAHTSRKNYNLYSEAKRNSNTDSSPTNSHDKQFHQTPNEVDTENIQILREKAPTDETNATVDVSASELMMPNVTSIPSFDEVEMAIASIIPTGNEYNSGLVAESMEFMDPTFTLDRPNKENCISLNKIESLPGLTIEEQVIDSANDNKSAISKVHSSRSKSNYYKLAKQCSNVYSDTFDFDRYVDFLQLYMDNSIKKNKAEIEKINDELESLTENEREEKQELEKEKSIFEKFNDYYKSFLSLEKEQYIPKTVLEIERENENVPKCKPIYKKALTDFVESWKSENVVDDTAKLNLGKCQSMLNKFCTGDHNGNDNDRNIPGQNINAITFGAPSYVPTPIQPTGATSEAVSSSSYTGEISSPSTYLAVHGCNQNTVDLTQLIPDSYLISYSVPKSSYPVENAQLNGKAQTEVLSSATIKNANGDGQDAIPKMTNDNKQSIGHSKEEKKANSHEKTTDGKNVTEKSRSSGKDKTTTKSDKIEGTTTKNDKEDGGTSSYIKGDANNSRMKTTDHEGEDESDDEGDEENLLKQFKKQIKRSTSFNAMPLAETVEYLKKN
ncbi:unnamed protein product [Bemisia tabaci]|uniref:Uncharacterized protein n=1 Tax=Bemisia tabaci TaxID=7038 RepID=A0A9P0F5V6_BEMTA|nr:unnamed protein product [Bemisia tabaci]